MAIDRRLWRKKTAVTAVAKQLMYMDLKELKEFKKNLKEFDEKTGKIALHLHLLNHDTRAIIKVEGLYFPNSKEILSLWDMISQKEDKKLRESTNQIKYNKSKGLSSLFLNALKTRINLPNLNIHFNKTKEYLGDVIYRLEPNNKNMYTITSEELSDAISLALINTGLFDNDIRLNAIKVVPKTNLIQCFTASTVGYTGVIDDVPKAIYKKLY